VPFGSRVQVNGRPDCSASSRRQRPSCPWADRGSRRWSLQCPEGLATGSGEADKVPAFVVFNDRTLEELSSERPRTVAELLAIGGLVLRRLIDTVIRSSRLSSRPKGMSDVRRLPTQWRDRLCIHRQLRYPVSLIQAFTSLRRVLGAMLLI